MSYTMNHTMSHVMPQLDVAPVRSHFEHLTDASHTQVAGACLGRALHGMELPEALLITLHGELGAGKTTFVGGLMRALGHEGVVRSPTYTLIEPYELSGLSLFHLDLYRLTDPMQLEDLGWRDLFQPGTVLLVEWPEQAGASLGKVDLAVSLAYLANGEEGRSLEIQARSALGARVLGQVLIRTST